VSETNNWFGRLMVMHRASLRKVAQEYRLQWVHLEALDYYGRCNRYSDTAAALSEYLGQTKGSLSQTLALLEREGLLKRSQDAVDKRVFHLKLTAKSRAMLRVLRDEVDLPDRALPDVQVLQDAVRALQQANDMKSFGVCKTCRFHRPIDEQSFHCRLTDERLHGNESELLCREHAH
jgi:DNA-binding MarR family transcriptional regulator